MGNDSKPRRRIRNKEAQAPAPVPAYGAVPQGAAPQVVIPQVTVPQGAVPQGAAPQVAVPQGTVQQAGAPHNHLQGAIPEIDITPDLVENKPVIEFDHVYLQYPVQNDNEDRALEDISLTVQAGEFVFLVGHSGSGKSTLVRLITREIVPTSGKVYIAGEDISQMRHWRVPYLRRNIGCVFQDFKLLPDKTVYENVAFALEAIGKKRSLIKVQVPEVLRLVSLLDKKDKLPDQLSGGEQQRVSIARAIVNRPPLLVCDEPTGNLDPQTSSGIMELLERINRTGTTVLVATHDREMVDRMRKRVIALNHGHLERDQDRGVYTYRG